MLDIPGALLKRILALDDKTILLQEEKRKRCQARSQTKTDIHAVNGKRVTVPDMEWKELHMPLSTQQIQEKSVYAEAMGIALLFKLPVSNKCENMQIKYISKMFNVTVIY